MKGSLQLYVLPFIALGEEMGHQNIKKLIFREFYTYSDVIVRHEWLMVLKNPADM